MTLPMAAITPAITSRLKEPLPFAMNMFNLQTPSAIGSAAVTGFALGCGNVLGTVEPLLGGLLSSATGRWTVPLLVFPAKAIPLVLGAHLLTRSGKFADRVERQMN